MPQNFPFHVPTRFSSKLAGTTRRGPAIGPAQPASAVTTTAKTAQANARCLDVPVGAHGAFHSLPQCRDMPRLRSRTARESIHALRPLTPARAHTKPAERRATEHDRGDRAT